MYGGSYFGRSFFGGGFFGDGGPASPPAASPAQIWAYVLGNGKSAGQNLVEVNAALTGVLAGGVTLAEALSILLAVAAGKSTIIPLGNGAAHVEFRAIDDSKVVVSAEMTGSSRSEVNLDP